MKKYYAIAAIVLILNLLLYPVTIHYSYLMRGHKAYGGEHILFIFGFFAAFWVIDLGLEKKGGKQ